MDDTVGPNNTNAFNILHLIKVRIVNCEQLLLALGSMTLCWNLTDNNPTYCTQTSKTIHHKASSHVRSGSLCKDGYKSIIEIPELSVLPPDFYFPTITAYTTHNRVQSFFTW